MQLPTSIYINHSCEWDSYMAQMRIIKSFGKRPFEIAKSKWKRNIDADVRDVDLGTSAELNWF
jgi:hypothetical protein